MASVTFDKVTCTYPGTDQPAVDALDLTVADGEFMVLVGPSGCGKSTSLRLLAGLEEPTSGAIWIGDRDVTELAPKDRDIAMVFQNYALYPHMSVAENMGFALKIAGVPKGEITKRVQDAAVLLGLDPYLARKPKALSGGQRQRVAMGRAIVREPRVFLLDEPLSNLDAKLRVQTRTQIAALQRRLGCSYGIPSPSGGYALQLSAEAYRDDAAATARIPVNVDALRTPGVNPIPITIGPTTAMYLPLPDGPFLIASTGIYAVSVTLGPTSFTPDKAPAAAAAVAAMTLTRMRGGTAAGAVTP